VLLFSYLPQNLRALHGAASFTSACLENGGVIPVQSRRTGSMAGKRFNLRENIPRKRQWQGGEQKKQPAHLTIMGLLTGESGAAPDGKLR
jgi:hypothetical protein